MEQLDLNPKLGRNLFETSNQRNAVKKFVAFLLLTFVAVTAYSEEIFKIEVGRDYKKYSNNDLQRRVWELERAVWQLQQKIYHLETHKPTAAVDTWVCTIDAMGNTYTGTGPSKAIATMKAVESCKAGNNGSGFFCKDAKCAD